MHEMEGETNWILAIICLIFLLILISPPFIAFILTLYGIRNRKNVFGRSNVVAGTAIYLSYFATLLILPILASLLGF